MFFGWILLLFLSKYLIMDYVYAIGGLIVWLLIAFLFRKIFLDFQFKKFDLGNGNYYFKASVFELIFQRLIINIPLTIAAIYGIVISYGFSFWVILLSLLLLLAGFELFIRRPIRTIRNNWHMKINDGKFYYFNGKENHFEIEKLRSVQEKRQSASRGSSTYIFDVDGVKIEIDFYDYGLDGGYAERISAILQKEINH